MELVETRQYFTMSKKSFCGYVEVDGKRQAKFKRQTSMRLSDAAAQRDEAEGTSRLLPEK